MPTKREPAGMHEAPKRALFDVGKKIYTAALKKAQAEQPDLALVERLLEKAIELGSPDAAYALGSWYVNGKHVNRNYKRGVELFRLAATANIPEALYSLAYAYETGRGARKSERKAFEFYVRAVLHGDKQSVNEVGRAYFYGIGVRRDRRLAEIWHDRAEELGVYE